MKYFLKKTKQICSKNKDKHVHFFWQAALREPSEVAFAWWRSWPLLSDVWAFFLFLASIWSRPPGPSPWIIEDASPAEAT